MRKIVYYTHISDNLETAVLDALINLGWSNIKNDNVYTVEFSGSLSTWGAIMKIYMVNDRQCNIEIKHKVPTTIFDWGFSVNKIDELVREIQKL